MASVIKGGLFEEVTFELRLKRQEGGSHALVWGGSIPNKGMAEATFPRRQKGDWCCL